MTPINGLKRIARERSWSAVTDFWYYHKAFIGWIVVSILLPLAIIQSFYAASDAQKAADKNAEAITKIEEERNDRINVQSSVNAFFCQQNNQQDAILGKLVAISLAGAPPKNQLTPQQLESLNVFQQAEKELNSPTDCHKLALALARATGVDLKHVIITPLLGISIERRSEGEGQTKAQGEGNGNGNSINSTSGNAAQGDEGVTTLPEDHGSKGATHPTPGGPTTGKGEGHGHGTDEGEHQGSGVQEGPVQPGGVGDTGTGSGVPGPVVTAPPPTVPPTQAPQEKPDAVTAIVETTKEKLCPVTGSNGLTEKLGEAILGC